jgi:hypothetical protein
MDFPDTSEFEALTGDAETGVSFPSSEPLRERSPETDDVGSTVVLSEFEADFPHEAFGFGD